MSALRRLLRSPVALLALTLLALIVGGAVLGPEISVWDSEAMDFAAMQAAPSAQHWFGTDLVGRDQFVRTMLGARVSLSIALLAISVSLLIGVPWGMLAALLGGRWDQLMMRFVDVLYGLPVILIIILLVVIFGRNQYLLFAALGAFFWLDIARIVRGQTLRLRDAPFIQAARGMGAGRAYTLWRHVLPNVAGPVIVYTTLAIPGVILAESFISFLGLGIQEPDTSWGVLVSDGAQTLESAPWLIIYPGLCLGATIWSFNTLGDRLRDMLDNPDNRRLN
ncbi:MAG: ABC transporter permease [Pseudomonadota bacterium]